MMNLMLIFAAVLIIGIFLAIFRISTLASIIRNPGEKEQVNPSGNAVHGVLFLILPLIGVIAGGWYGYKHFNLYVMPHASKNAELTEPLFWIGTAIIIAMFLITNAALFYFAFKYRHKTNNKAHFFPDNMKLEVIWTIVPAIILTTLIFTGWRAWREIMYASPKESQVIEIMGHQFAWKVRYAGTDNEIGKSDFRYVDGDNEMGMDFTDPKTKDDFMVSEIHIVKDKPVELKIRARDVLHSVSIPHFRQKMDAVPGMPTRMWFVPTKTTAEMRQELRKMPEWQMIDEKTQKPRYENFNYEIACQEICGRGHFAMRYVIVVDTQEDYDKWLATQVPFMEKNKEYVAEAIKKQMKIQKEGGNASVLDGKSNKTIKQTASFH